jgi:hypothetical protein
MGQWSEQDVHGVPTQGISRGTHGVAFAVRSADVSFWYPVLPWTFPPWMLPYKEVPKVSRDAAEAFWPVEMIL